MLLLMMIRRDALCRRPSSRWEKEASTCTTQERVSSHRHPDHRHRSLLHNSTRTDTWSCFSHTLCSRCLLLPEGSSSGVPAQVWNHHHGRTVRHVLGPERYSTWMNTVVHDNTAGQTQDVNMLQYRVHRWVHRWVHTSFLTKYTVENYILI